MRCFSCKKEIQVQGLIGRRDECECGADLHCCKNCAHYDPRAYNECKEPQADRILEKERANFCDHFTPGNLSGDDKAQKDKLKNAAEALFKKS